MTTENIENHMAYTCKCGGVNFALLKSGGIECNKCSSQLDGVKWWAGGMGAQLARAIKAEDQRDALQAKLAAMEPPVPAAWTNLLAYVLQDDMHNQLTPRVIDIEQITDFAKLVRNAAMEECAKECEVWNDEPLSHTSVAAIIRNLKDKT